MQQNFQSKIDQLTDYMRPLLQEGVDITALYIVQAHLTSFKALVKPINILMNLFSPSQLGKMLVMTRKRVKQLKEQYGSYTKESEQRRLEDNVRFKVSVKDFHQQPFEDLTVIFKQLFQTLLEWQIIRTKSQRFRLSLQKQYTSLSTQSVQQIKKQLQVQLELLVRYNSDKQFKICESTECFSSYEDQQFPIALKKLGESDVSLLFQYVMRWSNQICQEIQDFKTIIQTTKEESSVDFDGEYSMARGRNSSCFTYQPREKQKTTLELPEHKMKSALKSKLLKQKTPMKQRKQLSFYLSINESIQTKQNLKIRSLDQSRKVQSDISQKGNRRAQVKSKRNEQSCKCLIY